MGFSIGRFKFLVQWSEKNDKFWWTKSFVDRKVNHLFGLWFENREEGIIFGFILYRLMIRLGYYTP